MMHLQGLFLLFGLHVGAQPSDPSAGRTTTTMTMKAIKGQHQSSAERPAAGGPLRRRLDERVHVVPLSDGVYRYSVCDDEEMSNQLLYHAAALADAYRLGKEAIQIPNYFFLNVKEKKGETQQQQQQQQQSLPESLPFGVVFEQLHFVQKAKEELQLHAFFVASHGETSTTTSSSSRNKNETSIPPPCMRLETLQQVDAHLVRRILRTYFRPSKRIQHDIVDPILEEIREKDASHGICLHYPHGPSWQKTCRDWSSIPDGVYRGNCLLEPNSQSLVEALEVRGLKDAPRQQRQHQHQSQQTQQRWIYYTGDVEMSPVELVDSDYEVFSRNDFLPDTAQAALYQRLIVSGQEQSTTTTIHSEAALREVWSFVDFVVCQSFDRFVGNSVSPFSAVQIGLRDHVDKAFWYNSQSIPLASFWQHGGSVYQVPVVYTYTELSMATGKHLLQSSIASVRAQMPHNAIHILYHGNNDTAFQTWLRHWNVTIHHHDPVWRHKIEEMRQHGDPAASNLFLHSGNYFGTWQRIDIPLFLDTEYCLLLDADTVLTQPFTLADFGLNLTHGIAMSSEIFYDDTVPANAGVTLMNVPHMKRSYHDFMKFIMGHVETAKFDHPSPSDQGAYLVFYKNETYFLSRRFNYKPYWQIPKREFQKTFIVHFHGPKPHDYLKFIMGKGCDTAIKSLCVEAIRTTRLPTNFVCQSIQIFAKSSMAVDPYAYCNASFPIYSHQVFCQQIFQAMAQPTEDCTNFPRLIQGALDAVPRKLKLPRDIIKKKMGLARSKSLWRLYKASVAGWIMIIVTMYKCRNNPRVVAIMSLVWALLTIIFSFVYLKEDHF